MDLFLEIASFLEPNLSQWVRLRLVCSNLYHLGTSPRWVGLLKPSWKGEMDVCQLAHLEGLRYLSFRYYTSPITDSSVLALSQHIHLKYLDLARCWNATGQGLQALSALEKLQYLDLSSSSLGSADLEVLMPRMSSLQTLLLDRCSQITDPGLHAISLQTGIQKLQLSVCKQVTDAGVQALSRLVELKHLNLGSCELLTDKGVEALSNLSQLHTLRLDCCFELGDSGLRELSRLAGLVHLSLAGCIKITDEGVRTLSSLGSLEVVDFSQTLITGRGFRSWRLSKLRSLYVAGCHLSDSSLRAVAMLSSLEILDCSGCSKLTDRGLRVLLPLKKLISVNFHDCRLVTAAGLKILAALPSLALPSWQNMELQESLNVLRDHRFVP